MCGCSGVDARERETMNEAYRDCGLSYLTIDARVGQDPVTVSRIWNRWVQDSNTECHAGSQRPPFTTSGEDWHVTRMALLERAATSRALSEELWTFARKQVTERTVS
ncbi:HTH_Tnp_Tc3_2 domain-containing protein [Trichonephila clavipes]|uniref:HTH_Tnp_Tc3_2 domain-containing protein n=1 Tax=Trichonephila clavipes TaxID=2585209 RepID=A0A8X6SDP9_TRICX|nr:HTH_Tnp_Tc3_2 domain-containing protein [Trichonephila clavipes]